MSTEDRRTGSRGIIGGSARLCKAPCRKRPHPVLGTEADRERVRRDPEADIERACLGLPDQGEFRAQVREVEGRLRSARALAREFVDHGKALGEEVAS